MSRTVDFTGVGDFTPAPIGDYTLTGTKYEWKNNKDGDGEHCEFTYTIQDETAADGTTPVSGKLIRTNYSPKHQALWKVKNDAIALGLDPDLFEGAVDLDVVIPAMIGRSGIGSLTISEYTRNDGTPGSRNELAKLSAITSPELEEAVGSGRGRRGG